MIPKNLQEELESQLAHQLEHQLDPVIEQSIEQTPRTQRSNNTAKLLGHALDNIQLASRQIKKEQAIAEKYQGLCQTVQGLLGNYRKISGENTTYRDRLKRLLTSMSRQKAEIADLKQQLEIATARIAVLENVRPAGAQIIDDGEYTEQARMEKLIGRALSQIASIENESIAKQHGLGGTRNSGPDVEDIGAHNGLLEDIDEVLYQLRDADAANENRLAA